MIRPHRLADFDRSFDFDGFADPAISLCRSRPRLENQWAAACQFCAQYGMAGTRVHDATNELLESRHPTIGMDRECFLSQHYCPYGFGTTGESRYWRAILARH